MSQPEEWIATRRPQIVSDDLEDSAIPDAVLSDPELSLIAKGLYALTLTTQGQPINPYEDAFEDADDIRAAIEERVEAGLIVRMGTQL